MKKIILISIGLLLLSIFGCSKTIASSNENSPAQIFNIIALGVKDCNFEKVIPFLSSKIQEEPFGKPYSNLLDNCNGLVSDENCLNGCSSNEKLFQKYGYDCERVCNTDCKDKKTVLEIGCIFNTRNYQKHTVSFKIINTEKISEDETLLSINKTIDYEFSQVEDEDKVINIIFVKENGQWKLDSPLYNFE